MDINRKDYSENRVIKRINEARNYKNKYSSMMVAAHAAGKSAAEIHDEMSSWFAKNAARADINREAQQNRSQLRSEHNTTEKFDKMNYKGYKYPRVVNDSEHCYDKFCYMNDLNPMDFTYNDFIELLAMRDSDESATAKYNREMNSYIDEVNPTFYEGDYYKDDIYADIDEKLGINTKGLMHLNEMSDELLNRATIAAMDRGDFEKAKKFNAWKNDPKRKENLAASELIKNAPLVIALPSNKTKFKELLGRAVKNHEILSMPSYIPSITVRAYNYAEANGWKTIGDLMVVDLENLRKTTSYKKSNESLIDLLEGIGFHWDAAQKKWCK